MKAKDFYGIVGESLLMLELYRLIRKVAPNGHTVLISGEMGTGKELVVRALHSLSSRQNKPLIMINCGALNPQLIESELFGHEKGAFTGAHERRLGAFELAGEGIMCLDEIGELPLELQPKLLRVLENRVVRRVGGQADIPIRARIFASTNRDLATMVTGGTFRGDLFYRLNALTLTIPPLRQRGHDVLLIADHFLRTLEDGSTKHLAACVRKALLNHSWPGNIRELRNVILRSLLHSRTDTITARDLSLNPTPLTFRDAALSRDGIEKRLILRALAETRGDRKKAAKTLGIARSTFYRRLKVHFGDLQGHLLTAIGVEKILSMLD